MNLITRWWKDHKTKTLGALTVAFGAAQTYLPQIQGWFKRPEHYGAVFMGIGVVTALLGFLNSHKDEPPK